MKNKTQLIIFPYNGNGLEALDCLTDEYELIGFVDDQENKQGKTSDGIPVYSRVAFDKFKEAKVLAVPGSPSSFRDKEKIITGLKLSPTRFATIIHPSASISSYAKIGKNVLILAGTVVTAHAAIRDHVLILANSVIHHESVVGEYALIGSNVTVAGRTTLGNGCYIGSGTSIINGISIGERTLIGLGSNVIKSIPSNVTAVGNPARVI